MSEITGFSFDLETLRSLEGVVDSSHDACPGRVQGLGFNVTVRPECETTGFALGNIIIGRVIGQFKRGGGRAAILTLKRDGDSV